MYASNRLLPMEKPLPNRGEKSGKHGGEPTEQRRRPKGHACAEAKPHHSTHENVGGEVEIKIHSRKSDVDRQKEKQYGGYRRDPAAEHPSEAEGSAEGAAEGGGGMTGGEGGAVGAPAHQHAHVGPPLKGAQALGKGLHHQVGKGRCEKSAAQNANAAKARGGNERKGNGDQDPNDPNVPDIGEKGHQHVKRLRAMTAEIVQ